LSGGKEGK